MKRTMNRLLAVVCFVVALFTATPGLCFYNPSTGRWLSRDPMGEAGAVNLYSTLQNHPLESVDRLGLDDVASWAKQHAVAYARIDALLKEAQHYEMLGVEGWPEPLLLLRMVIRRVPQVDAIAEFPQPAYRTGEGVMHLGPNPDPPTVAHELVHAFNDLMRTGFTEDRADEGMAYALEAVYAVRSSLVALEDALKQGQPEVKRNSLVSKWQVVWRTHNAPSQFPVVWNDQRSQGTLETIDFVRIRDVLGAKVNCEKLARVATRLAQAHDSCSVFTCEACGRSPYEIPAGVAIDSTFK
jgi:hypothetical protein